jgi:sterol desaturase/sphingolipid hydroxylase (fatty acid hydroxylase superfamily)
MTVREFVANVAVIVAFMGLLSVIEIAAPLFVGRETSGRRRVSNLALTVLTFVLNWALTSAAGAVAIALSIDRRGSLASSGLTELAQIAISVVTLDLGTYFAHVSMHELPVLWRSHRIHHSDRFLDVTTTFRQHPFEAVWRFVWIIIPVWAFGLPVAGLLVYRLLSAVQGVFEHANISVWPAADRAVSLVWCTPNMHKIHHSQARRQTDSNYGNILSVFDRLFGTFRPTAEAFHVVYGLENVDRERARSFSALLGLPFARV